MPILDQQLAFTGYGASGYAPTLHAQDNFAPNSIDTAPLGLDAKSGGSATTGYNSGSSTNAGRDLGIGTEFWLQVLVTVSVTSSAGATVIFYLATDAAATISTAAAPSTQILLASPSIDKTKLTAKSFFRAPLPASGSYLEFLALDIYINTTDLTAGTFEGVLLPNIQQSDLYLSGFFVN